MAINPMDLLHASKERLAAAAAAFRNPLSLRTDPNPNARRLVQSRAGVDSDEAAESRRAAAEFFAQAESGATIDTTEYLHKRIAELG